MVISSAVAAGTGNLRGMHQPAAAGDRPGKARARPGESFTQNRGMTKPVTKAETLVTEDGVPIEAVHLAGDRQSGFVVAHGFTLHWQRPHVWRSPTG